MSDFRIGRIARALRHRLGWRQSDVARRAAVSQDFVSRIERGRVDPVSVGKLRRVLSAVDAELVLQVRWRGGELDRLLDEGHAALVGAVAGLLTALGWAIHLEVSFAVYGERGSIDILGWHPSTHTLLVAEIKTEVTSVEETLRHHDSKARLGARIAKDRFNWTPRTVARLLVLPDLSTARRRVARHESIFSRAYPLRGRELRDQLRGPDAMAGGLLFLSPKHGVRGGRRQPSRKRITASRHVQVSSVAAVRGGPTAPSTHQVRR